MPRLILHVIWLSNASAIPGQDQPRLAIRALSRAVQPGFHAKRTHLPRPIEKASAQYQSLMHVHRGLVSRIS
jgi:hypothetical protein